MRGLGPTLPGVAPGTGEPGLATPVIRAGGQ